LGLKLGFPPRNRPLITNTDTDLAHFITVSGDVYHDASTSSTNDDGGLHSLNSDAFSFNDDHMTDIYK